MPAPKVPSTVFSCQKHPASLTTALVNIDDPTALFTSASVIPLQSAVRKTPPGGRGAGEVGVVRLGPAEIVVGAEQGIAGLVRAVEEVLQPAAPAHVTDEDVQLAVRSELDNPAIVIAATGRRRRFAREGWL